MKTLHSLEWGHSEIDIISDTEGDIATLGISVALLTGLGSFETLADKLNLFFGFTERDRKSVV